MKIRAVLFDLDGTLLPMEQDDFANAYVGGLVQAAAPNGYRADQMAQAILDGTKAMVKNTGTKTNEEVFWDVLVQSFGESIRKDAHMFDEFYRTDFQKVRYSCGYSPRAKEIVNLAKECGFETVLATNPLFPSVATESRIAWAGLDVSDFLFFTAYEESRYCKPNLAYYQTIFERLRLSPEECLMIGNDVGEDMIVSRMGASVFLLTDCLINRKNEDISQFPHGNFDDLATFLQNI